MEIDQIVHVEEIRLQRKSGKFELATLGGPWQPLWAAPVVCGSGVRVLPPSLAAAAGKVTRDYES